MIRSRFTRVAFALGLGLLGGCLCLRSHPLFQKRSGASDCECATATPTIPEGPMLSEGTVSLPPTVTPPDGAATMPPLAPPPRLVPQPQPQAQPIPYVPR